MRCLCDQKETSDLKIEGDIGADPIWCAKCGCNLDLDDLPISNELKEKLAGWETKYGNWIDWDADKIVPNGVEMEEAHNREGEILAEQTKQELKGKYRMTFSPSTMGRSYASKN